MAKQNKYMKKKYKKNKTKTQALTKRVKKLEKLTEEVVNRSFIYNYGTEDAALNSGLVVQDPFLLRSIHNVDVSTGVPSEVSYGKRLGPSILVTRLNMLLKLRFASTLVANRWQRIRCILFKIPPHFTSQAGASEPIPLASDILEMTVGTDKVGKTNAYYKKNSQLTYSIIKDKTCMLSNNLVRENPNAYNPNPNNIKYIEWNLSFKDGIKIDYDQYGHPKNDQYRLLIVSENDVDSQDTFTQCPAVNFLSRVNYIM